MSALPSPSSAGAEPVPAAPLPSTRTRILDEAEALLLARGFNAFAYQHIAQALGIKPAAVHYHFATKEALGVALITRQRERLSKWVAKPRIADLSPTAQLAALLTVYETHLSHNRRLCFFGSLAAEFNTLPEPMQAELRTFSAELNQWVAGVLAAGRQSAEFRFIGHPAAKAAQVLTTLAGALQVARVHGDRLFHLIAGQLQTELLVTGPGDLPAISA